MKLKMNNSTLQDFFLNVTKLTDKYNELQRYNSKLYEENKNLKQKNKELQSQNSDAKETLHQIITQLKDIQS